MFFLVKYRRETDAQRRAALTEAVQKLERSLDAEIKRRAEADKSIQASLEAEIKAVHEKLSGQIREQNLQLKVNAHSGPFPLLGLFCVLWTKNLRSLLSYERKH
jgi:hypothetical protein